MQTFLPFRDLQRSARCLDNLRLQKQRVECKQIVLTLTTSRKAWRNHPAVAMYRTLGGLTLLREYCAAICAECDRRKIADHTKTRAWFDEAFKTLPDDLDENMVLRPWWFGCERLFSSHRISLLRKDPEHYANSMYLMNHDSALIRGMLSDPDSGYVWPMHSHEWNFDGLEIAPDPSDDDLVAVGLSPGDVDEEPIASIWLTRYSKPQVWRGYTSPSDEHWLLSPSPFCGNKRHDVQYLLEDGVNRYDGLETTNFTSYDDATSAIVAEAV